MSEAIGGLVASTAQLLGFGLAHDADWAAFRERHPGVHLPSLGEVSTAIQQRVAVLERFTLDEPLTMRPCPDCDGSGRAPEYGEAGLCSRCDGGGRIRVNREDEGGAWPNAI